MRRDLLRQGTKPSWWLPRLIPLGLRRPTVRNRRCCPCHEPCPHKPSLLPSTGRVPMRPWTPRYRDYRNPDDNRAVRPPCNTDPSPCESELRVLQGSRIESCTRGPST